MKKDKENFPYAGKKAKILRLMIPLVVLGMMATFSPAQGYEVWLTDQSDTADKSGGYLYVYDGAQLADRALGSPFKFSA